VNRQGIRSFPEPFFIFIRKKINPKRICVSKELPYQAGFARAPRTKENQIAVFT